MNTSRRRAALCLAGTAVVFSSSWAGPYDHAGLAFDPVPAGSIGKGNHEGLPDWNRPSLRMLYPEAEPPIAITGTTVVLVGQPVQLQMGWRPKGARVPFGVGSMLWRVDGVQHGDAVDFRHTFERPGSYIVSLTMVDLLSRVHTGETVVRVRARRPAGTLVPALTTINLNLLLATEWSLFQDGFGE